MVYRSLGRTGVQISALSLGSMLFGTSTPAADAARLIDTALDRGINSLDTANVYGRGASEEAVGAALRRNGRRDRIVLASKVHARMDDDDPNAAGNSRRHVIEQCHASLKRLAVDHLDIYYVHRPSTEVPIDETLRALTDLVRAGTVRYIGASSFAAWQHLEGLWASSERGLERFVAEQTPYSLLDRRVERELLPMAATYGTGIMVWSPLAGGMLSGKYRGTMRPAGARLEGDDSDWVRRHFVPAAFAVVDEVAAVAEAKGCTPVQLALAWTLARPEISSVVLGARSPDQLEDQLGALDVLLEPQELARLDAVSPPGRAIVPYYLDDDFADWRAHRHRW
jgi:aryl-alcohol dehydrogenase-like predicted oxidoreductase